MKPARPPVVPPGDPDPWRFLAGLTPARIALGRAGASVPTRPLLEFQLAHARARDAVQRDLDAAALAARLAGCGFEALQLHSRARDRRMFIARPDLGRDLDDASRVLLKSLPGTHELCDCVFVVADGLSALAIETHAVPLLVELRTRLGSDGWRLGPVCIVQQGRVAVGDEVGALLAARMSVLLVGERPGLSSPDSLGVYLTWDPAPGRTNAERNCISNIRPPDGLAYALAAHKLHFLMTEARRRRLSGVGLKEDAPSLPELPGPALPGG
jgi:ethanolamine ammonia-lyase small subunit